MEFINLKAAYKAYEKEFDAAIKAQCEQAAFIGGNAVSEFEAQLGDYVKTPCISCSDGTNALILALKAAGIKAGDEIITSPFTFIATAEAIAICGARVVFADIGSDFCLDPSKVKKLIGPYTKAIIAVSLFGNTSCLNELADIAKEHNILLIEDAAQSFGARTNDGAYSCSVADISTTSFFPSKPLGGFGDGGAVFCNNPTILDRLKLLTNHGSKERYKHEIIGTNSRLDAIQAAILSIKLKHLDGELNRRKELAARYNRELCSDFILPRFSGESAWAQYCLMCDNRDEFCRILNERGIPTAIYYPIPLHLQPAFAQLGYQKGDFPMAEFAAEHVCALPFSAYLSDEEQTQIIDAANAAVKEINGALSLADSRALVIGAGIMGKNHIRELAKSGFNIDVIDPAQPDLSEFSPKKLTLINTPRPDYDLAIIASPSSLHAKCAADLKSNYRALIIEKPLANSLKETIDIDDAAFVGFNERFNAAFVRLCAEIKDVQILSAKFIRASQRPARINDVDVAADLGSHDLDLAQFLGFDLNSLELKERRDSYFHAQSKELEIISSWEATKPLRGVLIDSNKGKIAADLKNLRIYKNPSQNGEFEFMGEKFCSCEKLAGFSNLASMHIAALNQLEKVARKKDGAAIIASLERLKNN